MLLVFAETILKTVRHMQNEVERRWTVTAMTRKDKLLEARAAISEGMERTAVQRDIWQNELIWWLCKAVLLLIEKELKNK